MHEVLEKGWKKKKKTESGDRGIGVGTNRPILTIVSRNRSITQQHCSMAWHGMAYLGELGELGGASFTRSLALSQVDIFLEVILPLIETGAIWDRYSSSS